jgi:hypothetical protein
MLYQLSYASSIPPESTRSPAERTGTLPLRTYYGTEIKVSIPATAEQTRKRQGKGMGEQAMGPLWASFVQAFIPAPNWERKVEENHEIFSFGRYFGAPLIGAQVARVPREDPVVAFEVFDAVLQLAVNRLVQLLDNDAASGPDAGKMILDILDKDRKRLGSAARLCGT